MADIHNEKPFLGRWTYLLTLLFTCLPHGRKTRIRLTYRRTMRTSTCSRDHHADTGGATCLRRRVRVIQHLLEFHAAESPPHLPRVLWIICLPMTTALLPIRHLQSPLLFVVLNYALRSRLTHSGSLRQRGRLLMTSGVRGYLLRESFQV